MLEEVRGDTKNLGLFRCLAQHKWRWRRAVAAAYKYIRVDDGNRQRVWKVMDKVGMSEWPQAVQEHV